MKKHPLPLLFCILFLVCSGASLSPPEPWPNEFEGNVNVNGESVVDREVIAFVGGEEEKRFTADENGYEVLVSGSEGESVEFFVKNKTGGLTDAGKDFEIREFGEKRSVGLEFTIEDPRPRVSTGDIIDRGREYAVVEASTAFLSEESEIYVEYNSTESQIKDVTNSTTESFNLTGLKQDSRYNYKAYLETSTRTINGTTKTFQTLEKPGMNIEDFSNLKEGHATAQISGETISNTSINSKGECSIEIPFKELYTNEDTEITIKGKQKYLELESDTTKQVYFNLTNNKEKEKKANTANNQETQSEKTETDDQTSEQTPNENNQVDKIEDTNNMEENSSKETIDNSTTDQAITGQFFEQEVNTTTVVLLTGIISIGIFILRA